MNQILVQTRRVGGDAKARTISFVLSTSSEDRMGDTIAVDGWKLANYMANPVLLWCHQDRRLPIGRAVDVRKTVGGLVGDYQFASAEEYPFADNVYRLYVGGYLNAGSVGFLPLRYEVRRTPGGDFEGLNFLEQELTEFSCVSVPANPEALAFARSLGADPARLTQAIDAQRSYADSRAALIAAAAPPIVDFSRHRNFAAHAAAKAALIGV